MKGSRGCDKCGGRLPRSRNLSEAPARIGTAKPGSFVSWRCSLWALLERLCGPNCQQCYHRNEWHLPWLSQKAVLLRHALVLCYIPALRLWIFYLWLPKRQSLRGTGEARKMAQVLKTKAANTESHSAWRGKCLPLKPVGKPLESTTRQQNKCTTKNCLLPSNNLTTKKGIVQFKVQLLRLGRRR